MGIRVAIMGFGRMGRNIFRALHGRDDIEIVAINDIADPKAMIYLLRFDTAAWPVQGARDLPRRLPLRRGPAHPVAAAGHYQRIPREYWADRLMKIKAAGLNTVGTYVFWNALEPEPGRWDFSGGNDLAAFIRTAKRAGLWVLVRPGPYACAEWDFGGLPAWLLRTPDIKVRCSDPRYLEACERYILKLAEVLRDLQVGRGGPVLMVQIENEYGSYGNDRLYMARLKAVWERNGIAGPFFTADGPTPYMLEAGRVPGAAVGLDSGSSESDWDLARSIAPTPTRGTSTPGAARPTRAGSASRCATSGTRSGCCRSPSYEPTPTVRSPTCRCCARAIASR